MKTGKGYIRLFLIIIVFLDMMGFSVIFPIIPDLMEYYLHPAENGTGLISEWILRNHASAIIVLGGIITSLWAFLQFLSAPVWGRISDRVGRKKVLIITAAGLSISYLLWACATTLPLFIAHRVLGGIMAGNIGVAFAAMADISSAKERTQEMGLMGAAAGIGMIVGPVLGGFLSAESIRSVITSIPHMHPFSAAALASTILFAFNALMMTQFPETITAQTKHSARPAP
ncbi:MAG: MFS transporter, partial [Spirochaetota bacterium]